jgi:hypothetical protein
MIKGIKRDALLKDIRDIANYYRLTKVTTIINLVISIMYNFLILMFIIGTIYSVVSNGMISSLFGDKQDLTRRFECKSSSFNDTVKSYDEAKSFVDLYKGNCFLYHISVGE